MRKKRTGLKLVSTQDGGLVFDPSRNSLVVVMGHTENGEKIIDRRVSTSSRVFLASLARASFLAVSLVKCTRLERFPINTAASAFSSLTFSCQSVTLTPEPHTPTSPSKSSHAENQARPGTVKTRWMSLFVIVVIIIIVVIVVILRGTLGNVASQRASPSCLTKKAANIVDMLAMLARILTDSIFELLQRDFGRLGLIN